jgi:hypothetical protein
MKKWGMVLLLLVIILGAADRVIGIEPKPAGAKTGSSQAQKTKQVIWTGKSGGFEIRWTSADLEAQPLKHPDRVAFSARALAQKDFARFCAEEKKYDWKDRYCEIGRHFELLSVVGSLLSLLDGTEVYCDQSAHPSHTNRFATMDLAKPGEFPAKRVKLTDYFPEKVILKALLADPVIKKALRQRQRSQPPKTLGELYAWFKGESFKVGECSYYLPEDFLTRFAFHHLDQGNVAIRLALPYDAEVCRGYFIELGLLLPIPASLRESLAQAKTRKAGFLMQDQKGIAGGRSTLMEFTKGKEEPEPGPVPANR